MERAGARKKAQKKDEIVLAEKKLSVMLLLGVISTTLFSFFLYASQRWVNNVEAQMDRVQIEGQVKSLEIRELQIQLKEIVLVVNRIDARTERLYRQSYGYKQNDEEK